VLAVRPADGVTIHGTAAKMGDVLEIYAAGLGETTIVMAPGLVFSGAYANVTVPPVAIGGQLQ
jgi:uncharacterized protein (TIGR03437 family)